MKVFLDSVGCRLNQSEIESYARQFRAAGHVIVGSPDQADLVVINTCAVTAAAASDSRQKIRQAAQATAGKISVTGCWATLEREAALALPKVSQVVANTDKDRLVGNLLDLPAGALEGYDLLHVRLVHLGKAVRCVCSHAVKLSVGSFLHYTTNRRREGNRGEIYGRGSLP